MDRSYRTLSNGGQGFVGICLYIYLCMRICVRLYAHASAINTNGTELCHYHKHIVPDIRANRIVIFSSHARHNKNLGSLHSL